MIQSPRETVAAAMADLAVLCALHVAGRRLLFLQSQTGGRVGLEPNRVTCPACDFFGEPDVSIRIDSDASVSVRVDRLRLGGGRLLSPSAEVDESDGGDLFLLRGLVEQ